jgi:hypothetical protein
MATAPPQPISGCLQPRPHPVASARLLVLGFLVFVETTAFSSDIIGGYEEYLQAMTTGSTMSG